MWPIIGSVGRATMIRISFFSTDRSLSATVIGLALAIVYSRVDLLRP